MNRMYSHLDEVNWIGKLADLKEEHYRNTLLLSTLVELLVEKGIVTVQEIQEKTRQQDTLL